MQVLFERHLFGPFGDVKWQRREIQFPGRRLIRTEWPGSASYVGSIYRDGVEETWNSDSWGKIFQQISKRVLSLLSLQVLQSEFLS